MHTLSPAPSSASKPELYRHICDQLQALIEDEEDFIANAANTAALLFHSLPDVNWAGFYVRRGQELVLGPFQGKPACIRIPLGKGVCGAAASRGSSVLVPNTAEFPGHISCDPASKSEIVVPLISWGNVVGVLDLDSPVLSRFDEDDCEGLESVASILLSQSNVGADPDLADAAREAQEV